MLNQILEYLKIYIFDNSYVSMVFAVLIVFITIFIRWTFAKVFIRVINKSSAEINNDPTNYKFLKHAISALIYVIGFSAAIYTIPALRSITNSLLAGAGILAVAIGFASQHAFANIISGVFIVMFKPFRVNDRIELNEKIVGLVEDITLRHTVIRNFENRRIIIPNSVISQEILVNSDIVDKKVCNRMDLGIAYNADIKKVRAIIQEEAINHLNFIDNRKEDQINRNEHPVVVRVLSWGESSINLRVWLWAESSALAFTMACDLHESIKERFDKENIEIPFPYRNVIVKKEI